MNKNDEERIAAHLAKTMAMMCVCYAMLADIQRRARPHHSDSRPRNGE